MDPLMLAVDPITMARLRQVIWQTIANYEKGLEYENGMIVPKLPLKTPYQEHCDKMERYHKVNMAAAMHPERFAHIYSRFQTFGSVAVDIGKLYIDYEDALFAYFRKTAFTTLLAFYLERSPEPRRADTPFSDAERLDPYAPWNVYPNGDTDVMMIIESIFHEINPGRLFGTPVLEYGRFNCHDFVYCQQFL